MALDPQARRAEGVSPISTADLEGSRGKDGYGVNLPKSSYTNPGPTANIRGIEANTNWGGSTTEPVIDTSPAGEVPRGEKFDTSDSSGLNAAGGTEEKWDTVDSSSRNSHTTVYPQDSFSAMGESYPANGGRDGES